jgi:hypothetical protein
MKRLIVEDWMRDIIVTREYAGIVRCPLDLPKIKSGKGAHR